MFIFQASFSLKRNNKDKKIRKRFIKLNYFSLIVVILSLLFSSTYTSSSYTIFFLAFGKQLKYGFKTAPLLLANKAAFSATFGPLNEDELANNNSSAMNLNRGLGNVLTTNATGASLKANTTNKTSEANTTSITVKTNTSKTPTTKIATGTTMTARLILAVSFNVSFGSVELQKELESILKVGKKSVFVGTCACYPPLAAAITTIITGTLSLIPSKATPSINSTKKKSNHSLIITNASQSITNASQLFAKKFPFAFYNDRKEVQDNKKITIHIILRKDGGLLNLAVGVNINNETNYTTNASNYTTTEANYTTNASNYTTTEANYTTNATSHLYNTTSAQLPSTTTITTNFAPTTVYPKCAGDKPQLGCLVTFATEDLKELAKKEAANGLIPNVIGVIQPDLTTTLFPTSSPSSKNESSSNKNLMIIIIIIVVSVVVFLIMIFVFCLILRRQRTEVASQNSFGKFIYYEKWQDDENIPFTLIQRQDPINSPFSPLNSTYVTNNKNDNDNNYGKNRDGSYNDSLLGNLSEKNGNKSVEEEEDEVFSSNSNPD